MVPRSSRHVRGVWDMPAPSLLCNRMGLSAALTTSPSIHKNTSGRLLVLYALSMRLASVIVGSVPCVQPVRGQTKVPAMLAGSVPLVSPSRSRVPLLFLTRPWMYRRSVEAENAPTLDCESGSTPPASHDADSLVSPLPMSTPKKHTLPVGYGPPTFSARSAHAGFAGTDFALQPDGTVLCPAKHSLSLLEHRPLSNGSIRLVYAARISHCRDCPLRSACQGPDNKPRYVLAESMPSVSLSQFQSPRSRSIPLLLRLSYTSATVREPASAPGEAASLDTAPVSPSAASIQTVREPASAPVEVASLDTEPVSPPASPIQTVREPASAPGEAASLDTAPVSPPASPIQTVREPASAPGEAASLDTTPVSPPTASDSAEGSSRSSPVRRSDWPASHIRQQWLKRLRTETVLLTIGPASTPEPTPDPELLVLTRAQRAHWRMSWRERFARNARRETAPALSITLHGLPASFAQTFALDIAA